MIGSLPTRILAAAGLLAVLLLALVITENQARASGQEVVLPMEAVDPREILTGHYSDLSLTQRLPLGWACPNNLPTRDKPGWLALRPAGDHYLLNGGAPTREAARRLGPVVVQGYGWCRRVVDPITSQDVDAVTLEIGVKRFHADQDEAERMDRLLRARPGQGAVPAFVVVSVGKDGRARLKGVILDGQRTDLTWW